MTRARARVSVAAGWSESGSPWGRFSLAIGAEDGTRATPAAKPERRSRGKLADTSSGRSQTDAVGSEAISNVQRILHSTLQ